LRQRMKREAQSGRRIAAGVRGQLKRIIYRVGIGDFEGVQSWLGQPEGVSIPIFRAVDKVWVALLAESSL